MTAPATNTKLLDAIQKELPPTTATRLEEATKAIVHAKKQGGKVVVVTGSGPNIHEGVTTLVAGMIRQEIVDGIITSSAVIAHELAGSLDKVKRLPGGNLGFALQEPMSLREPPAGQYFLPRGEVFEITELTEKEIDTISADFPVDKPLLKKASGLEGSVIIKAAGNMAYPMGPRTEALASTLLKISKKKREPLEAIAGPGADPMTMIGAASARGIPVLVSIPQMVGGGNVGICIGDSISIKDRCDRVARLLGSASVIVESALALAQEIHDGPFETYTGHGIWAPVTGTPTYSLRDKHLIRIDLDPALQTVWEKEHAGGDVQRAIDDGKPKTKLFNVPFRMEMSGFARLEKSKPVIGDIGAIWPLLARGVAEGLGKRLDFTSYPQGTPDGQVMREWIVENVSFFDFARWNAKTRR
jgi:hypothetical protein